MMLDWCNFQMPDWGLSLSNHEEQLMPGLNNQRKNEFLKIPDCWEEQFLLGLRNSGMHYSL